MCYILKVVQRLKQACNFQVERAWKWEEAMLPKQNNNSNKKKGLCLLGDYTLPSYVCIPSVSSSLFLFLELRDICVCVSHLIAERK